MAGSKQSYGGGVYIEGDAVFENVLIQGNKAKTSKERQFWKAVYNGCEAAK